MILFVLMAAGQAWLAAAPLKYLEMVKSQPVEVNGLQFVAATQAQWLGKPGGSDLSIEIQLLITNTSQGDLVFSTFDTFAPQLKSADGKEIPLGGVRNGTMAAISVLIRAGDTYCLVRRAALLWKLSGPTSADIPDGKGGTIHWQANSDSIMAGFGTNPNHESGLLYWDGTGTLDTYKPLQAGTYGLLFSITSGEKEAARETEKLGGLKVWSGKVETKEAPFEIVEETD